MSTVEVNGIEVDDEVYGDSGAVLGTIFGGMVLMDERIPDATPRVFEAGHLCVIQDRTVMSAAIDFLSAA